MGSLGLLARAHGLCGGIPASSFARRIIVTVLGIIMVMRRIGVVPINISGIPRSPTVAPLHNYCLFPPGVASLFIALLLPSQFPPLVRSIVSI